MFSVYHKFIAKIMPIFAAVIVLMMTSVAPVGAAEYNCGAYGAGAYQENVCAATTDSAGGGLVNTGQSIWPILLAVLLILTGIFILYRTRKKMKARTSQNF